MTLQVNSTPPRSPFVTGRAIAAASTPNGSPSTPVRSAVLEAGGADSDDGDSVSTKLIDGMDTNTSGDSGVDATPVRGGAIHGYGAGLGLSDVLSVSTMWSADSGEEALRLPAGVAAVPGPNVDPSARSQGVVARCCWRVADESVARVRTLVLCGVLSVTFGGLFLAFTCTNTSTNGGTRDTANCTFFAACGGALVGLGALTLTLACLSMLCAGGGSSSSWAAYVPSPPPVAMPLAQQHQPRSAPAALHRSGSLKARQLRERGGGGVASDSAV
jgi:hypothetical protein